MANQKKPTQADIKRAIELDVLRPVKGCECSMHRYCGNDAIVQFRSPYSLRGYSASPVYSFCPEHLASWWPTVEHVVAGDTLDYAATDKTLDHRNAWVATPDATPGKPRFVNLAQGRALRNMS